MQAKSILSRKKSNVIVMADFITQRDLEELAELKKALKVADRRFDDQTESVESLLRAGHASSPASTRSLSSKCRSSAS